MTEITGAKLGLNAHEFLEPAIKGHTSPLGMHEGDASLFENIGKNVANKVKKFVGALDLNNGNVFGTKEALKGAPDDVLMQTYKKYQNPTTKQGDAILKYIKEEMKNRGMSDGNGILSKVKDKLAALPWKKMGKYALIGGAILGALYLLNKCTGNNGKKENVTPNPTPNPVPSPVPSPVPNPVPNPVPSPVPTPVPSPVPTPEPCEDKDLGNTFIEYHRKGGDTWKGIVEAHYPDLVEKCGGKMYGEGGAIRTLQKALCTDITTGVLDEEKLRKTITSTDLPKTMFLPKEIGEIKVQENEIKKVKIVPGGTEAKVDSLGSYTRAIQRCGEDEVSYVPVK